MTINNRIELIISTLGLNNNSFSIRIGVNPTVIHNIVKGRNAPSYDIIQKIALSFDNISLRWLIVEKGDMFYGKDDPINKIEPPGEKNCPECQSKDKALKYTEKALKHAEAALENAKGEIESRKEQISLLIEKISMIENAHQDGEQKRKTA